MTTGRVRLASDPANKNAASIIISPQRQQSRTLASAITAATAGIGGTSTVFP